MMNMQWHPIRIFVFLLIGLHSLTASEAFFPMQPGNFWEYRTPDGTHGFSVRGFVPLSANGRVYYFVNGFAATQLTLREEIGQGIRMYDGDTATESLYTSLDPNQPQFTAPDRGCGMVTGRLEPNRVAVSTPVGGFPRSLQVTYDTPACTEPVVQSEFFVANVGMVRRVVKVGNELRQYDLVSARVGGQVILPATDSTVTSLSWQSPRAGDAELRFRLQVVPTLGGLTRMKFASSQRYDLVIRDANGNKVWQYSDGQSFLPVTFETEVANFQITVPLSSLPGGSIRAGQYTVDAWLTTERDNPRFAASIGMIVPDFGQIQPTLGGAVDRIANRMARRLPLPGRSVRF
jgi:hypothetical protein